MSGRRSSRRRLRPPSRLGPVWGRPIAWFFVHIYYRTQIRGKGYVPRKGPAVIIANHVGFIDGPVATGVTPRYMNVLVKAEMFVNVFGVILRGSGQIEVEQGGREALARGRAVLPRPGRRLIAEFGEPIALDLPADLRVRERQQRAEEIVAEALRAHVARVAAGAPIKLPQDDPLREGHLA